MIPSKYIYKYMKVVEKVYGLKFIAQVNQDTLATLMEAVVDLQEGLTLENIWFYSYFKSVIFHFSTLYLRTKFFL